MGLHKYTEPGDTLHILQAGWRQEADSMLIIWFERRNDDWIGLEGLTWDTRRVVF
jgi:hypothetical protein